MRRRVAGPRTVWAVGVCGVAPVGVRGCCAGACGRVAGRVYCRVVGRIRAVLVLGVLGREGCVGLMGSATWDASSVGRRAEASHPPTCSYGARSWYGAFSL